MTRMLFLGLLLLAGSGAFTALAIVGDLSGGPAYTVSVLDHHIATMNASRCSARASRRRWSSAWVWR
jgi:hypothetical protein